MMIDLFFDNVYTNDDLRNEIGNLYGPDANYTYATVYIKQVDLDNFAFEVCDILDTIPLPINIEYIVSTFKKYIKTNKNNILGIEMQDLEKYFNDIYIHKYKKR